MTSQELLDTLVRDLGQVHQTWMPKSEIRRKIEEYGDKRVEEEMNNIGRIADMLDDKDFELKLCQFCGQMTNHLHNICQKHNPN